MYIQLRIPIKYCHAACTFWFSFFLYALLLNPCKSQDRWHCHLPKAQHPHQHELNHHSIFLSFYIFEEFIPIAFLHGRKTPLSLEGAVPSTVQCQPTDICLAASSMEPPPHSFQVSQKCRCLHSRYRFMY